MFLIAVGDESICVCFKTLHDSDNGAMTIQAQFTRTNKITTGNDVKSVKLNMLLVMSFSRWEYQFFHQCVSHIRSLVLTLRVILEHFCSSLGLHVRDGDDSIC